MIEYLNSPLSHNLFLTLVHFLWQGFLIGLVYCLVAASIRGSNASFRYGLSLLALLSMALCPVLTFVWFQHSAPAATQFANSASAPSPTAALGSPSAGAASHAADHKLPAPLASEPLPLAGSASELNLPALAKAQRYVLLAWLAGVLVCGVRLSMGFVGLVWIRADHRELPEQLMRYSQTLATRLGMRSAGVFASSRTPVACVVGLLKPVVLLPASWLSELPPEVLQAVIAHELAHIRRFDTWVNLLQRVLETLLFYHPMVWWLSNRVRYERELCCDQLAVAATGNRRIYIRALEQVGRLQVHGGLNLTPAFTGDQKMNLLSRVQHILRTPRRDREPAWLVGVAVLVSALAAAVASGTVSDSPAAFAQQRDGDRSEEAERGDRRTPETERGDRRSPEAERGERRSPEAERGGRRVPEAERRDRPSPEAEARRDAREPIRRFQPQTDREAALYRMIVELQREVAELRRAVGPPHDRRDGEHPPRDRAQQDRYGFDGERRGDDRERDQPRFGGDRDRVRPQVDPAHRQLQKIFGSRDRNRDNRLNRDEFNSLFEGGPRNEVFDAADRNEDGGLSFDEFVEHRLGRPAREGDRESDRPREREGESDRPREGDRAPERIRDREPERERDFERDRERAPERERER